MIDSYEKTFVVSPSGIELPAKIELRFYNVDRPQPNKKKHRKQKYFGKIMVAR